jgi:hypothetical protein
MMFAVLIFLRIEDFQGKYMCHDFTLCLYGSKREEITGGWRKFHDEELHNLCSSPRVLTVINKRR